MRDHRKLIAFDKADDLTMTIYKITFSFPREEIYGLTSQIRRAAVSLTTNIVEGAARESEVEFLRFLEVSFASYREVEYQFSVAKRLNYVKAEEVDLCEQKIAETGKVLAALIRKLRNK